MQPVTKLNEDTLRERLLGSMPKAGETTMQPLSREEAEATIQTLRSVSLWQIPQEPGELRLFNRLLDTLQRPINREDAAYWTGRLLQHFPGRQNERDGIIISDLATDLEGMSHCAVIEATDHLRKSATAQNPYLPPSGEILSRVRDTQKAWANRKLAMSCPVVEHKPVQATARAVPWAYKTLGQVEREGMTEQVRQHVRDLPDDRRRDYLLYLTAQCAYPKNFMEG